MKWFLLAYVVISLLVFDPKPFLGGDNARYIILAEALVSGEGYCDIQLIGKPLHRTFPPGLPLLLAPLVMAFGRDIVILKLFIVLTGVIGYAFFIKLTQSILPPLYALFATLTYLLTPVIYTYSHYALSEVPFTTCVLASVWFMVKK